ncbi:MAG: extracellular solute-binding protein [Pseudobutyrivibrio sp.]|nr:extracellular solute-binding protein [Pseudobutyrivibrio sp.]
MKLKKILSLALAGTMMAATFAACGEDQTKAEEETTEVVEEATTEEAASAGDEETYDHQAIEKAGDITITMMVSGTAAENDFETEVLPKLINEKWPNVTLEVTKLPDDNYYTSLKTKLASGECPDIILTQPMYAGQNSCYSMAEAGYLVPLNDLDCVKGRHDMAAVTYNGDVVTATCSVSILGTYYNKDLFEQVGITSEPKTWDEFLEDCQKLQDAGIQPIVMGDKDQYVLQFGLYQIAANEIYPKNADYDTQLRTGDTSFTDKDTWDKVLEMYGTLYERGYIDASKSLGMGAAQAIQAFIDGEAAMTFDGSFNAPAILASGAAGDFARGYFPIPSTSGEQYTATCLAGGESIYSGSEYIDECKEILDYWMDGSSPVWEASLASGKVIATYGNGADEIENYDLFAPFVSLMNKGNGFYWCNQAWPAGTETEMEALFSEMIGGQGTTVEDITQGMQDKFEDLLED